MLRLLVLLSCIYVHAAAESSFCVIELFTSEGCSSCPPADNIVNQLVDQARQQDKAIYVLAFHVDYWDTLKTSHGTWKDPFSNKAHTAYQKVYAHKNPIPGRKGMLVTPQILIDGDHIKGGQIKLDEHLNKKRSSSVDQTLVKEAQQIHVTHTAKDAPQGAVLCIALVERGLRSEITAGENANKTLDHQNVVRSFYRNELATAPAIVTLTIPGDCKLEHCSVISYLQDGNSMHTLAATQSDTVDIKEKGQSEIPTFTCEDGQCVIAIDELEKDKTDP